MPNEDDIELGCVRRVSSFRFYDDNSSRLSSSRSSLESGRQGQSCDIYVHDDVPTQDVENIMEMNNRPDAGSNSKACGSLEELKACLVVRTNL